MFNMRMISTKLRILITLVLGLTLGLFSPPLASAQDTKAQADTPSWIFIESDLEDFFGQFFGKKFEAKLDGAQEIPGPGDIDGVGEARIKITDTASKSELCADVEADYIDQASAAHIHHAPAGSSGAVVVSLPIPNEDGEAEGCVEIQPSLLKAIKDSPEDYYINIHTSPYPEGAIRGQLQ